MSVQNSILEGKLCWTGEGDVYQQSNNSRISLNGIRTSPSQTETSSNGWKKKAWQSELSHYKLRDWLFSRQRYWGEPFPILHFADGTKRVLDLDELPLLPPEMVDFKPTGDGQSPLAQVKGLGRNH